MQVHNAKVIVAAFGPCMENCGGKYARGGHIERNYADPQVGSWHTFKPPWAGSDGPYIQMGDSYFQGASVQASVTRYKKKWPLKVRVAQGGTSNPFK